MPRKKDVAVGEVLVRLGRGEKGRGGRTAEDEEGCEGGLLGAAPSHGWGWRG